MLNILLITALVLGTFQSFSQTTAADDHDGQLTRFLALGEISGKARDLSGLSEVLAPVEATTPEVDSKSRTFSNDLFGGISAICWTGIDDIYWLLPDRGPLDGAVDWTCRVQKARIMVDPTGKSPIKTALLETVVLHDARGIPFTGMASAFKKTRTRTRRFDPEGIRVGNDGNLFISDEYGPRVIEFTSKGKFVRELDVPDKYLIANPDVSKKTENPKNKTGRGTNRGMEGLAISSDGQQLFGLMQSPLLQDSYRATMEDKPLGLNCRLPSFDLDGVFGKEFVYQLDDESYKLNEILSCGPNLFVVIERDGEAGPEAEFKKIMLISTSTASNVAAVEKLPRTELPAAIKPVSKMVLIDLLDEKWRLAGDQMPEKIEGLTFGPDIGTGHRLLLVASDNDFVPEQSTKIYAFAVPRSALATSIFQQ